MRRLLFVGALLLLSTSIAPAEDHPAPQAKPDLDPNAVVSLTVRELQAIITYNVEATKVEAALSGPAKAAIAKVQAQATKK